MTPCFSSVCLPERDWRGVLGFARDAGFTVVELMMIEGWVHVQPAEVSPREVTIELRRLGLRLAACHAGGLDGQDDSSLERTLTHIEAVHDWAAEVGADLVVFNGGFLNGRSPDPYERQAGIDRMASGLRRLGTRLARSGLHAAVENHCGFQIETLEHWQRLFSQAADTPNLGATLDTGHGTACGLDLASLVFGLGRRVLHVHIKDHLGHSSVALGAGATDNRGCVVALRSVGYTGLLSVELEVKDREKAECYARESLPYLQALAGVV